MQTSVLALEEKVYLALKVELGCSPRHTQMVPKWHLAGQLAGTEVFHCVCVRGVTRKKVSVFAGSEIRWLRLAEKMEEKVGFEGGV